MKIDKRVTLKNEVKYRVVIRLKGFPTETATFERLTDARRWGASIETSMREGRYFKRPETRKKTVADLIDRYTENVLPCRVGDLKTVAGQLKWWRKQIGHMILSDVTVPVLSTYRDLIKRKSATVRRYLVTLSVCFTYAMEDLGWVEDNPVLRVKKPKLPGGRVRFLSDEERASLLEACEEPLRSIVTIALYTGARRGEVLGLQWKDIDFQGRMVRLEKTKNGERRSIPISSPVLVVLQGQQRRLDSPYIFPRGDGKQRKNVNKAWYDALEASKLEDFHFHDLRHTAASYLAMSGATLTEIAAILGLKTMQMVKRYAHLTEQHTADVAERMAQRYA